MLFWKYSPNRTFFLNEYWVIVPLVIIINYKIISKIRSQKERIRLLKELKDQLEYKKK